MLASPSRRATAALVLVVALAIAACTPGSSSSAAAIVDGDTISMDVVRAEVALVTGSPEGAQLAATPEGRLQAQAQALTELIRREVVTQAARDVGVEVTDDDVAELRDEIVQREFGGDEEAFAALLEGQNLTEEIVAELLRSQLLAERLTVELSADIQITDAEIEEYFDRNIGRWHTAVVRHIQTADEDSAEEVLSRLDDGEDFAALAAEVSMDQQSGAAGGDIGIISRAQTPPDFDELVFTTDLDEPAGPVQTDLGWHVVLVEQRTTPDLDEVRDMVAEELRAQQAQPALESHLSDRLASAEVRVNPRIGHWDDEARQVVADRGVLDTQG